MHPEISTFVVPVTHQTPDLQCVRVIPQLFSSAVKASLKLLQPKSPSPGAVSAGSKALWVAAAQGLAEHQLGSWQLMDSLSLGGDFLVGFSFWLVLLFFPLSELPQGKKEEVEGHSELQHLSSQVTVTREGALLCFLWLSNCPQMGRRQ